MDRDQAGTQESSENGQTRGRAGEQEPLRPSHIVGIGASAGGLEALQKFFSSMRDDSGLAFVIIQHLSPHFKSMMDELLSRHTTLPVVVVNAPMDVEPNTVYLLPPRREMVIEGYHLSVREKPVDVQQQPISTFFSSLARQHGERAIAVVLSGTGSDGSSGVVEVREAGGLVFVQSEASAKFDGMPHNALSTGVAHGVYAPERIPWAILQTIEHGEIDPDAGFDENYTDGFPALEQIIERLNTVYDLDFKLYKPGTIHRRIERRMALAQMTSAQRYADYVVENTAELESLYKDMLIGVTQFFRNPQAFDVLRDRVIPAIMDDPEARPEVRVWVPGCASGEEAYSVAMLFLEALEDQHPPRKLRVFATDRHRGSLQKAADGVYTAQEVEAVPEHLRNKYFVQEDDDRFRVVATLRRCLIFSTHNVIKDPPFTQLDLVSCRNLLIYFQPVAQNRALVSFYCGLRYNGHLFLGHSESCGNLQREFDTVDGRWKLYRKVTNHHIPFSMGTGVKGIGTQLFHQHRTRKDTGRNSRIYEALVGRYVPTGVLLNADREVLHLFGDASEFLRPRPGPVSNDVVDLAEGNLRIALASALQGAMRGRASTALRGVRLEPAENGDASAPEQYRQVDVEVEVFDDRVSSEQFYLVTLVNLVEGRKVQLNGIDETSIKSEHEDQFDSQVASKNRIHALELELSQTRESLQTVVEELETSNEELQSSNEELLSSNEELQSTNEELHSVNEELYTVNAEYEQKIGDLNEATSDLRNFMEAVEVGSVFTDRSLKIRLFTPAATDVLNLIPQDVGRDLRHITSKVRGDMLLDDITEVLDLGIEKETELELPDGRVMLRRIRSYVDHQREPAGLILTFVEVTRIKRSEQRRRLVETRLRRALNQTRLGFWEHDLRGEQALWDQTVVETLGLDPKSLKTVDIEGVTFYEGSPKMWLELVVPEDRPRAAQIFEASPDDASSVPKELDLELQGPGSQARRKVRVTWDSLSEEGSELGEWRFGTLVGCS